MPGASKAAPVAHAFRLAPVVPRHAVRVGFAPGTEDRNSLRPSVTPESGAQAHATLPRVSADHVVFADDRANDPRDHDPPERITTEFPGARAKKTPKRATRLRGNGVRGALAGAGFRGSAHPRRRPRAAIIASANAARPRAADEYELSGTTAKLS